MVILTCTGYPCSNKINLRDYMASHVADIELIDEQRRTAILDELLADIPRKQPLRRQKIDEFIGSVRARARARFRQLDMYCNTA